MRRQPQGCKIKRLALIFAILSFAGDAVGQTWEVEISSGQAYSYVSLDSLVSRNLYLSVYSTGTDIYGLTIDVETIDLIRKNRGVGVRGILSFGFAVVAFPIGLFVGTWEFYPTTWEFIRGLVVATVSAILAAKSSDFVLRHSVLRDIEYDLSQMTPEEKVKTISKIMGKNWR